MYKKKYLNKQIDKKQSNFIVIDIDDYPFIFYTLQDCAKIGI